MYGELNPMFRNNAYYERLREARTPTTAAMTVQQYVETAMRSFDRAHEIDTINEFRGNPHDVLWNIAQALRGDHVLVEYCDLNTPMYKSIVKWGGDGHRLPYDEEDIVPIKAIYSIFDDRIAEEETFTLTIIKRSIDRLPEESIRSRYESAYRNIELVLTTYAKHGRPIEIFLTKKQKENLFYAKLSTP